MCLPFLNEDYLLRVNQIHAHHQEDKIYHTYLFLDYQMYFLYNLIDQIAMSIGYLILDSKKIVSVHCSLNWANT